MLLSFSLTHQWNGSGCIVGLFGHVYATVVALKVLANIMI
jgi:hypothetical protein